MRKLLISLALLVGVMSLGFNAYQWLGNRVDDLEPRLTRLSSANDLYVVTEALNGIGGRTQTC